MKISKIIIENFKGIKKVELGPIKPINVLIGRNNSGKSSILTLMSLFSEYLYSEKYNQENRHAFGYGEKPIEHNISKDYFQNNEEPIRLTVVVNLNLSDRQTLHTTIHKFWHQNRFSFPLHEELAITLFLKDSFQKMYFVFHAHNKSKKFGLEGIYTNIQTDKLKGSKQLIAKNNFYNPHIRHFIEFLANKRTNEPIEVKINKYFCDDQNFISKEQARDAFYNLLIDPPLKKLLEFFSSTFLVSPYRHGAEKEIPQFTENLDSNGNNIVRYLHNTALNENTVFEDIAGFVKKILPEVGRLHPRFTGKEDHTLELAYDWKNGHTVNLSNMGGGVEQLLILASILIKQRTSLILWEEPESHLHPGAQDTLIDLTEKYTGDSHIFLTTHSPVFIRPSENIAVHVITNMDGKNATGRTLSNESLQEACDVIGTRPGHLAQADIVIYVEGKYGRVVIEEWINKWPEKEVTFKHLRYVVQSINVEEIGGNEFEVEELKQINPNMIIFADNDTEDGQTAKKARQDLVEKCKQANIPCILTKLRQIEDYFTLEAIQNNIPTNIRKSWKHDPQKTMGEQFGKNWKKYNRNIAKAMDWKDIEIHKDLMGLFSEIEAIAKRLLPNNCT